METAVYVIIALVVLGFVFLLGALGRRGHAETTARLAAELEAERARVRELEAELQAARGGETS